MLEFFQQEIFTVYGQAVTLLRLVLVVVGVLLLVGFGYAIVFRWLNRFFEQEKTGEQEQRRTRRLILINLLLIAVVLLLLGLRLDRPLAETGFWSNLKWSNLVEALLIVELARLIDWVLSSLLSRRYHQRRQQEVVEGLRPYSRGAEVRVGRIVQPIVYLLAATFIIQQLDINEAIPVPWVKEEANYPRINTLLSAILVLLLTRLFIWIITELILYPYYRKKEINLGSQYAINRLLTYFFFVIAILAVLQYVGINLTVLWGGAAALLVGVGLGLQQTFNDLVCGIILLFERTVEVSDVVDINGLIGTVKKIGVRTSLVETRDQITVIVPNSKLVGENVINWSHLENKARFKIAVGVAYGSDTSLVRKVLEEAAQGHKKILSYPAPFVRFVNFGDSSLDFKLFFWSRELIPIEDVKSDLRFTIDRRFREENITIPFPQRDLWIKEGGFKPPSGDA
jgi:small-conductance mechanosensitive channel